MTTKKRTDRGGTQRPDAQMFSHYDAAEGVIHLGSGTGYWTSYWPDQKPFFASMYLEAARELVVKLHAAIVEAERLEKIREESLAGLNEDQKKALGLT